MMKGLLATLFLLHFVVNVDADGFQVENFLGVNCIRHTVHDKESLYEVASKFFIRPSTLAVVNNIEDPESVTAGRILYIPLTETNFYQTRGLKGSKYSFDPVYHVVQEERTLREISELFYVGEKNLLIWNEKLSEVTKGDKVIIGWVKYHTKITEEETPFFVKKEKILFGTIAERAEVRKSIQKINTTPKRIDFKDNTIPEKAIPIVAEESRKTTSKRRQGSIKTNPVPEEVKRKVLPIKDSISVIDSKYEKNEIENNPISRNGITKEEKNFLKKKEVKKRVAPKPKRVLNKLRSLTKNSYARDKEKLKAESRRANIVKKKRVTSLNTKPLSKAIILTPKEKKEPIELIDKSNSTKIIDTVEADEVDDPVYVQNKLQRLTLLNSSKGRAAFFYSGKAGAKFYVFTNVAGKGSIIKLTNLNNGKYILAEVIGLLPEVDRQRGYIVKLSDNSRRVLNIKSKSFSAKINY